MSKNTPEISILSQMFSKDNKSYINNDLVIRFNSYLRIEIFRHYIKLLK